MADKFYVYALCGVKDKNLYIGISSDPKDRVKQHNSGMTRSTRARRPFTLIYTEECADRKAARAREIVLKSGSGREFLKKFIPK